MTKDYKYIDKMIKMARTSFELDCCKESAELFRLKHYGNEASHKHYQNLLGFILAKSSTVK